MNRVLARLLNRFPVHFMAGSLAHRARHFRPLRRPASPRGMAMVLLGLAALQPALAQDPPQRPPAVPVQRPRELSHEPPPRLPRPDAPPPAAPPRGDLWQRLSADQRRGAMENLTPPAAEPAPRRMSPDERRALRQQIREAHQNQRREGAGR
jgi:uncharacterized membrane protein